MDLGIPSSKANARANFLHMTTCFAINHGCCTTCMVFASSVLNPDVAYFGNGILFLTKLVASLLFSVPLIDYVGLKRGLGLGMTLACGYVGGFTLAAFARAPFLQWCCFCIASLSGGLAAGIFWTAQGGFLAGTATVISDMEERPRDSVTAELASKFASDFLFFEAVARIMYSFLLSRSFSAGQVGGLYVFFAVACVVAMTQITDLQCERSKCQPSLAQSFRTIRLWGDARIWLLSFTNIAFGIQMAYMNGYFNATHAKPELGVDGIGYLTVFAVCTSILLTPVYCFLGKRFGNGIPIFLGAVSFACIALLMLLTSCCSNWGKWIVILYALQGSGRAVFESTNKAIYCDTFKGADTEGAFANLTLQQALASALCFFMSSYLSGHALEIMVLVFALLTPCGYIAKTRLDKNDAAESSPLMTEDKRVV